MTSLGRAVRLDLDELKLLLQTDQLTRDEFDLALREAGASLKGVAGSDGKAEQEMAKLNDRQADLVEFVRVHPGCSKWDAACFDWQGPGHSASYARVNRLIKRGALRAEQTKSGKYRLFVGVA